MKTTPKFVYLVAGVAASICLAAEPAAAHTTKVNFRCEAGGDVTFFAGNYHGSILAGGLIVDGGAPKAFTSVLTSLPGDATGGMSAICPNSIVPTAWQVVTVSGLSPGNHTVTTTSTSVVEAPWPSCFPRTFEISCAPADADGDGVPDDTDNCPDIANPDQADADGDGIGDVCEPDSDGDGVIDDIDNCVSTPNANQTDTDGDGQGDVCDVDDDGDGVDDDADNCQLIPNPDQADFDNDGQGDACDADVDGDGVNDAEDQCLNTAPAAVTDADGCSIAQLCPCENEWKNHGAYVRCVAHTSEGFVDLGLITEAEKDAIVSEAGESQCGHKK